ncbi:hypothetical protein M2137_002433 [Parabacteroides sp. PFB2-10]|uniref:contractile injection system tape measure protein n=1 Tax=Parabacteroides sp. PFB2-10 TaxID=1742405 RepID=UPI0024756DC2|nr:contractile injection system tape measure protein [Parabacteroides sp. PFB2-10]MDH6313643.1 hypothetical protein [Parabacteroides sp. PFB2-10]
MITIDTLSMDFRMENRSFAHELYGGWDSFCRHSVEKVIDDILDRYDSEQEVMEINGLDLEIGPIAEEEFYEKFPILLARALQEKFTALLYKQQDPFQQEIRIIPQSFHEKELFLFFLLNGYFPSGMVASANEKRSSTLLRSILQTQEKPGIREILAEQWHHTTFRRRFVMQYADQELEDVTEQLLPSESSFIVTYTRTVIQTQPTSEYHQIAQSDYRTVVWLFVLSYLLYDGSSSFSRKQFIHKTLSDLAAHYNLDKEILLRSLFLYLKKAGETESHHSLLMLLSDIQEELSAGESPFSANSPDEKAIFSKEKENLEELSLLRIKQQQQQREEEERFLEQEREKARMAGSNIEEDNKQQKEPTTLSEKQNSGTASPTVSTPDSKAEDREQKSQTPDAQIIDRANKIAGERDTEDIIQKQESQETPFAAKADGERKEFTENEEQESPLSVKDLINTDDPDEEREKNIGANSLRKEEIEEKEAIHLKEIEGEKHPGSSPSSEEGEETAAKQLEKTAGKTSRLAFGREEIKDKKAFKWHASPLLNTEESKQAVEKDRRIHIENAGLVLLSPFFSPLFKRLHYIEEGQFVHIEKQIQAIFLLQHLLYPDEQKWAEYALPLNKLLTGFPLTAESLPASVEISQYEAETCESLLAACGQQWQKMKNTSLQSLREAFLIRNGVLEQKENGWHLTVEEKAYDMLLDTIPWSYTPIRFPWMEAPIYVKWR